MFENIIYKIKKIYLFIIVFLIIFISLYTLNLKFPVVGKSNQILVSEESIIIDTIDFPKCKFEISNNLINSENLSVDIKIRYNQEMNIEINPQIDLTNKKVKYHFEEPHWFDNKTFLTKLTIEDIDQETETDFVVSNARNIKGTLQQPYYSELHQAHITIDTKEPKLEKIVIDSIAEDQSSIVYLYFDQEFKILQKELEHYFLGSEENTIYELNKNEKIIVLLSKPQINKKNLTEYNLNIDKGVIIDSSKNQNNNIKLNLSNAEEIIVELLEIDEIEPPIIMDIFTITEFEIEPGSSRAIVYFNEGVYSANNSNLTINNFTINNNSIKTVSHVAGENKATILFNELVTNYDDLLIEVNEIYNASGNVIIKENSKKTAQNNRKSLPLIKGWNLISFPENLENLNLSDILNPTSTLQIYKYTNSQWLPLNIYSNLNQGAYFINSSIIQELPIEFKKSVTLLNTSNLQPGWNLVGFPLNINIQNTFTLDEMLGNPIDYGTIILTGTNYNTVPFTYTLGEENSPILSPFEGYWLYLENNPRFLGE